MCTAWLAVMHMHWHPDGSQLLAAMLTYARDVQRLQLQAMADSDGHQPPGGSDLPCCNAEGKPVLGRGCTVIASGTRPLVLVTCCGATACQAMRTAGRWDYLPLAAEGASVHLDERVYAGGSLYAQRL